MPPLPVKEPPDFSPGMGSGEHPASMHVHQVCECAGGGYDEVTR